jgi:hypothetical protein
VQPRVWIVCRERLPDHRYSFPERARLQTGPTRRRGG